MAGSKEIRSKIGSVKNTQKITKAMEMVAASKMRKAQARMQATKPYAELALEMVHHLTKAHPEYKHPYLVGREVKSIGVILVSSDRGLAGGLNNNLFRKLLSQIKVWQGEGKSVSFSVIGKKGVSFFKTFGGKVVSASTDLGDAPKIKDILGSIRVMFDAYESGEIDAIYVAHNDFVNTMTQSPQIKQLVPVVGADSVKESYWDYIYEPDAKDVLDLLLKRYVEALIYNGVVENFACEQSARMVAMKNASDNAKEMIKELQLVYNKARQAAITQELAEIVGGAAAV